MGKFGSEIRDKHTGSATLGANGFSVRNINSLRSAKIACPVFLISPLEGHHSEAKVLCTHSTVIETEKYFRENFLGKFPFFLEGIYFLNYYFIFLSFKTSLY
jgi:hypothetical protein